MATQRVPAPSIITRNPATGEITGEYPSASAFDVTAAVESARKAQSAWAAVNVRERAQILRDFQQLLREAKEEVAALVTREAGKPLAESLANDVLVTLDAAGFYAREAFQFLRDTPVPHGNPALKTKRGRLVREPHGVLGIIGPWNYPLAIPASETLAALVLGNTVILKPSELTPACALKLRDLLIAAGVPKDVFQVVVGAGDTGSALLRSAIDKLVFTGSVATGKRIAVIAAERLLPVVLELGGKDPMIVLEDADLELAGSAAVWGAFMNAGQACLSVERCFVHRTIFERFVQACVVKANKLKVGNGADPHIDVGPLINARQAQIVEDHVSDAIRLGATIHCGGHRLAEIGPNFFAPTVLTGITSEMKLMREETFGPLLPIMPFDGDDEAIALANDSEFGLAASVWTRDRKRGEAIAARLCAGTVMVNDVLSCFGIPEAPHGGVKASGLGRSHGRAGMEEMVRLKYVDTERVSMKKPWWFGYGDGFFEGMSCFVDSLYARSWISRLRGLSRSAGLVKRRKL